MNTKANKSKIKKNWTNFYLNGSITYMYLWVVQKIAKPSVATRYWCNRPKQVRMCICRMWCNKKIISLLPVILHTYSDNGWRERMLFWSNSGRSLALLVSDWLANGYARRNNTRTGHNDWSKRNYSCTWCKWFILQIKIQVYQKMNPTNWKDWFVHRTGMGSVISLSPVSGKKVNTCEKR